MLWIHLDIKFTFPPDFCLRCEILCNDMNLQVVVVVLLLAGSF